MLEAAKDLATPIPDVIYRAVTIVTRRDIKTFDTREQALEWVTSHS